MLKCPQSTAGLLSGVDRRILFGICQRWLSRAHMGRNVRWSLQAAVQEEAESWLRLIEPHSVGDEQGATAMSISAQGDGGDSGDV